jgi:serine/threonine protein kinase
MKSENRTKKGFRRFRRRCLRKFRDWIVELRTALVRSDVNTASKTTSNLSELHNLSLESSQAADRKSQLEDELWDEKSATEMTNKLTAQVKHFSKDKQAKNKVTSESKNLNVQKHDGKDGVENGVAITNKSLGRTGEIDESQFDFLRVLGTGGFGTVFLVQKIHGADAGRLYAMKVLEKATIIKNSATLYTLTERRVLEAVRHHPFLVTFHYAFQNPSKLYLVLDYMSGGDLYTLRSKREFGERQVRIYVGEITLALEHLHNLGIMHRDVKLENILLDSGGHAVLSDFGLSKMFLPHEERKAYACCGTTRCTAPEVLKGSSVGYGMAVDWWSLGIVTYELLTGRSPFARRNKSDTNEDTCHRIFTEEPHIPDGISFYAAHFISRLLVKDPKKRLGGGKDDAKELKGHYFLKGINWSDLAQRKIWTPLVPQKTIEFDVSDCFDEFTKMNRTDLLDTLPPKSNEIFRGYTYASPSVLCSECEVNDEFFQPIAESCQDSTDNSSYKYTQMIEYLQMELGGLKRVQMRPDTKKRGQKSSARAAKKKTERKEAELLKANCIQKNNTAEKRKLKTGLRDAKNKIMPLEMELNEANCLWKRYNKEKGIVAVGLGANVKKNPVTESRTD